MHWREPEGGVCCQVLDFSASDEEVERSSTGSLSRGAVPKEAPGVISERNIYPCPSLPSSPFPLSLFLSWSGARTRFAVGINGCQAGRPVLSSQLSRASLLRTVQLTIKSLSLVHHHRSLFLSHLPSILPSDASLGRR